MRAIDEVARAIRDVRVEGGPPILPTPEMVEEMFRLAKANPEEFKRVLAEDLERQLLGEASRNVFGLLSVYEDAKRDRHRRLFGHPRSSVFIVGERLLVMHPAGGAA